MLINIADRFISLSDGLSELTGRIAGWMFVSVGLFICFEVFMRHVLTMPTVWVDEVSRIFQVWATFIAIAYVLKHRQHIVIDVAFRNASSKWRMWVETFSLLVIIFFSLTAARYSFEIWIKSTLAGHTTDTYLAVPKVYIESALWVGLSLLVLQSVAELLKQWINHRTGEHFPRV